VSRLATKQQTGIALLGHYIIAYGRPTRLVFSNEKPWTQAPQFVSF